MCKNCNDKKVVHAMDIKSGVYRIGPCPVCNSSKLQGDKNGN